MYGHRLSKTLHTKWIFFNGFTLLHQELQKNVLKYNYPTPPPSPKNCPNNSRREENILSTNPPIKRSIHIIYLSTYLQGVYILSIYPPIYKEYTYYLSIHLSTRSIHIIYLSTYLQGVYILSIYPPIYKEYTYYLYIHLSTRSIYIIYLSTYLQGVYILSIYPPIYKEYTYYLSMHLSTRSIHIIYLSTYLDKEYTYYLSISLCI